ncbi:MAG: hypothetical protein K0U93_28825 [Gammaproteobacteria bacterium]|nr:hypothetical protein [Gammaproteobacteria bacterium]
MAAAERGTSSEMGSLAIELFDAMDSSELMGVVDRRRVIDDRDACY